MTAISRHFILFLAATLCLVWLALPAYGQSAVSSCDRVAGTFLAVGQILDGDLPPHPITYLERYGDAANDGRHHFSYAFNIERGVGEVVMFGVKGEILFETTTRSHSCIGGILLRESIIS